MPIQIRLNVKKFNARIEKVKIRIAFAAKRAMDRATIDTADNIKVVFNGRPFGFKDDTGALRESIKGGFQKFTADGEVQGAVGAGGDNIGNEGKKTREYVQNVEFGEFSNAGLTAFLRPGVLQYEGIIKTAFEIQFLKEGLR